MDISRSALGTIISLVVVLNATVAVAEYSGPGQQCDSQATEDDAKSTLVNSPGGRKTGAEIVEFEDVVDNTGQAAGDSVLSCTATVLLNDGLAYRFQYQYELHGLDQLGSPPDFSKAHVLMRVLLGGRVRQKK